MAARSVTDAPPPQVGIKILFDPNSKGDSSKFSINDKPFLLFDRTIIRSDSNLSLDLSEYDIIVIAPIKCGGDITIQANSMLLLENLFSDNGSIELTTKTHLTSYVGEPCIAAKGCTVKGPPATVIKLDFEYLKGIIELFKEGTTVDGRSQLVDGLLACYEAIGDEETEYYPSEAFKFFGIPMDDPHIQKIGELIRAREEKQRIFRERHTVSLSKFERSYEKSKHVLFRSSSLQHIDPGYQGELDEIDTDRNEKIKKQSDLFKQFIKEGAELPLRKDPNADIEKWHAQEMAHLEKFAKLGLFEEKK